MTDPTTDTPAVPESVGVRCVNCGSHWDDERIASMRLIRPELRSCCPERKMGNIFSEAQMRAALDRAERAEANARTWEFNWCHERDIKLDAISRATTAEAALESARKVIGFYGGDNAWAEIRHDYGKTARQWLSANPAKETKG